MLTITFICLAAIAGDGETRLPGSRMETSEAVRQADLVITAKFIGALGIGGPSSGGGFSTSFGNEILATSVIKGGPVEPAEMKLYFAVLNCDVGMRRKGLDEKHPRLGGEYIVFIQKSKSVRSGMIPPALGGPRNVDDQEELAIKILPKSDENVRIVKDFVTGRTGPD